MVHRSLRAFQPSAADRPNMTTTTAPHQRSPVTVPHPTPRRTTTPATVVSIVRSTTANTPTDTFNTSNTSQFCNHYFDCAHFLYYTYKIHRRTSHLVYSLSTSQ
uniref:Uncharacterized protein n=1 Tax=Schizaphis graminum TaxID=13262 RepID=A0A2S2PBT7_SCHGA